MDNSNENSSLQEKLNKYDIDFFNHFSCLTYIQLRVKEYKEIFFRRFKNNFELNKGINVIRKIKRAKENTCYKLKIIYFQEFEIKRMVQSPQEDHNKL